MSNELPTTPVDAPSVGGVMEIMHAAIAKGIDADALEKLVNLKERIDANDARREFADALAEFQANCPKVKHNAKARIATNGGGAYSYSYATLDQIAATVRPHLHSLGFSYGWDARMEQGVMTVICTLRHRNGHSESGSFACPIENRKGMSGPQSAKSALTYARRCSLLQVLGITDADKDDDASVGSGGDGVTEPYVTAKKLSAEQRAHIEGLLQDSGADPKRFFAWVSTRIGNVVGAVEQITARVYPEAAAMLERKIAENGGQSS